MHECPARAGESKIARAALRTIAGVGGTGQLALRC